MAFLERCGLDVSAAPVLEALPPDILTTVIHEFDPSGTKDGNVLGRLQGYIRFLTVRRQKRGGADYAAGPCKRFHGTGY